MFFPSRLATVRFLLTLSLLLLLTTVSAGELRTHFRFARIDDVSQITTDGKYILLAAYNNKGYLLKSQLTSDDRKIASHIISLNSEGLNHIPDTLSIPPTNCIWQFRPENDGLWCLISLDGNKTFVPNKKGASDLSLTTNLKDRNILYWTISEQDRIFTLQNGSRHLSLNEGYDYFGLFSKKNGYQDFCIYRAISDTTEVDTNTIIPDIKFAYILPSTSNIQALQWGSNGTERVADVSEYLLHNNTLATDAPATRLRVENHRLITDNNTIIKDGAGGQWLLCADIPILQRGNSFQALCYDARKDNHAKWLTIDSIDGLIYRYFSSKPYAEDADTSFINHTLFLQGGWSKPQLSHLNLTPSITGIDLTRCTLPNPVPEITVSHSNRIIYVQENDTALLAKNQQNIVSCTTEGNTLITELKLIDTLPFHFDRDIEVLHDGQISYSRRMPDNQWQTLYLPFDIDEEMPDIALSTIESIEEKSVTVTSTSKLEAYTPALFRYYGKYVTNITFSGRSQTLRTTPEHSTEIFQGLNDSLDISLNMNCLALNTSGTAFVPALSGSVIAPFRAYLNTSSLSTKYIESNINGLHPAPLSPKTSETYDLEGRKIPQNTQNRKPLLFIRDRHVIHSLSH